METNVAITTLDNPFDPITEFQSWLSYDIQKGYGTCEKLARIVCNLPDSLSDEENNYFVEEAINDLVKEGTYDKDGNFVEYKKVFKN